LLLTWLPSYLSTALHVNLRDSVLYSSVPWIFAAFTDFVIGGWMVNELIRRGFDSSRVRQIVLVLGTALGLGILGAAQAHTPSLAIFWISISIGGLAAAAPVVWSIPSLIAPAGSVGRLGGILNFGNQLSAIAAPIVTGYVASATSSFAWAFAAATFFLLIGICGYVFLLARIEPIPDPA
jgi:MFS family permease